MANVLTDPFSTALLTDVTQAAAGVAGILHGAKIQPYIAPHVPLESSVLADFVVSTDANLLPTAITWSAAYRRAGSNNGVAIDGNDQLWQLASGANACQISGFLVLDSTGATLLFAEQLPAPIALTDTLSGVVYSPQFAIGGPNNGAGTIVG